MKKYIVYAGVNGAGKSTLFNMSRTKDSMPRVNSDEILKEIGDWRNKEDVLRAGKIAVKRIEEYFSSNISFNQETTLCGQAVFRNIRRAKEQGYIVEMHYVGVDSKEIAMDRITKRVLQGGHGIPDEVVERRYAESLQNLKKAISMCDLVSVYDNTDTIRRVAIFKNGELRVLSRRVPEWFADSGVQE